MHDEFNKPAPDVEYESVTHGDFNRLDFVPTKPAPTAVSNIMCKPDRNKLFHDEEFERIIFWQ